MATKKPSAAQLAARKKFAEAAKTRAKKAKKKPATKTIASKSQVTKKPPSKRLKARRAKPKVKGYFPNPREFIAYARKTLKGKKWYFTGSNFSSDIGAAKAYKNVETLRKAVSRFAKRVPPDFAVYCDVKK